ncbi:serine/threonine-protein phosphatase 4 regulatory subunit 2 [Sabethes cyaneus]|uniref:serine/threonine-protein phosphatase 4 regulatory subunit 2 n=1 Tax=Sabethes cyaneus TaxID=53552 RepID=UPI00221E2D1B|nr:serine/threonine-protein phosphatase 4 regulatory subunit 2 [Sabethes cyaneus]
MENPEEVLQLLERFTKLKQKEIPRELDDYLSFVARTGDTVYRWAVVKHLFREKLLHVITDFHDNTPSLADLPQCPNVDPFNYERMRRTLLECLDAFNSAPFTVQRICELLTEPRKQYTRIDKFMRAIEKNILVVSTQEPGRRRYDSENGDSLDSTVNGDDVCVDIEMDNEAFGIDSNEMVASSTSASASSSTSPASSSSSSSAPSTVTTTATTATTMTTAAAAAAAAVAKDTEPPAEEEKSSTAASTSEDQTSDKIAEEHPSDVQVDSVRKEDASSDQSLNDASEEPDSDKSTSTKQDATADADAAQNESEEKSESMTQLQEDKANVEPSLAPDAVDAVDAVAPPNRESTESTESVSKDADGAAAPSAVESRSSDDPKDQSTTTSSSGGDPSDDGQPQAKQAKLSDETKLVQTTVCTPLETAAAAEVSTDAKDELNSGSTDSLESNAHSSDSDLSPETSAQNLTSTLSQGLETVVHLAEAVHSEESLETVVQIIPCDPESVTTENGSEPEAVPIPPQVVLENPTEAEATDPSVPSSEETAAVVKPVDVEQQEPTVILSVPSDEMETAVSAPLLTSENVMATDEEETSNPITTATDAVVPMAADVASDGLTKPDDNAMDIDESSVEPMDQ